jgi:hypothetical protein
VPFLLVRPQTSNITIAVLVEIQLEWKVLILLVLALKRRMREEIIQMFSEFHLDKHCVLMVDRF